LVKKPTTSTSPKHVEPRQSGVVPIVNLEWIQKIHRDGAERGLFCGPSSVDTILRPPCRIYVNYITPQFSRNRHPNFQRVRSTVGTTSNPFHLARTSEPPDESFIVDPLRDQGRRLPLPAET